MPMIKKQKRGNRRIMLSERVRSIKPSPTLSMDTKAKEMKAAGVDVISFGVGEPDFDTPDHIKEAAIRAIKEGFTKYTPVPGIPALREAIAEKLRSDNAVDYRPEEVEYFLTDSGSFEG